MMQFLILFAQTNETFRVAELEALADMLDIAVDLSRYNTDSPFMVIDLPDETTAKRLIQRSILCKSIYEFYAQADNMESLHKSIKSTYNSNFWLPYKACSFKFDIISFQGSRDKTEQVKMIESFDYIKMEGPIRMKNADQVFTILEQYEETHHIGQIPRLQKVYFARHICDSSRKLIETYDLKKRRYIGTTSFEAELALVSCNIAQCAPGKIVYDPFVGTGSFLVCASEFGCLTMGSDIDPRTMRGKNIKTNIAANFKQYGTSSKFLDTMTMDFTHNAVRPDLKLDVILSDPPYGVREGLKVLGSKTDELAQEQKMAEIDGVPAYLAEGYIPPKKPYAFSSLIDDLLEFAAERLTERGRLAFWMPTSNEDMQVNSIPKNPALELIASGVQEFGKWSRVLLVYKRSNGKDLANGVENMSIQPVEEFRDKYFRGFRANSAA